MLLNDIAETRSLDGDWQFWFGENAAQQEIQVPGCWEAQGFPKDADGPARFRRMISLSDHWRGRALQLEFDAVSYACQVSVNGHTVGANQGMWMPFFFDMTSAARLGSDNTIELEVYKPGSQPGARYPMRSSLAGFLPDLATTFGGVWQPARLRALDAALSGLQVHTDYDRRAVRAACRAETFGKPLENAEWDVRVSFGKQMVANHREPCRPDHSLDASLPLSRVRYWSPAHPNLYNVQISLLEQGHPLAQVTRQLGFRRLSVSGEQLLLNGQPFMVRGILAWGWEPDRIAPYYTLDQARHEMQKARELGFNCIKLCLFVPNQDYFRAADEEGMLLWQELPMWLPEVTPALRAQAPAEYAVLAEQISPHPSVAIYSLGCELNRSVDLPLLSHLNDVVRGRVQDSLICDNSGSGESYGGLDFDFSDFTDYHPYYDIHYFEPLLDHWRRDWQSPRPWIFGEFCDSDTFRDLDEIIQANGSQPPWWMTGGNPVTTWRAEAQALLAEPQRLARAGLDALKPELVRISYAQAALIRKYTLETLRRRRAMGGYVITGLRDTAISTSGVWDDLDRPKWPAAEFLQFNGEDILTLELDRRRTWQHGGDRPDRLDPYNHWSGSQARWHVVLHAAERAFPPASRLHWQLSDTGGAIFAQGDSIVEQRIPAGRAARAAVIRCTIPVLSGPAELDLAVTLAGPGGRDVSNHWPIYVYPPLSPPPTRLTILDPTGVLADWGDWLKPIPRLQPGRALDSHALLLTTTWDAVLARQVENGARVLLLQQGEGPLPVRRCPFWREAVKIISEHKVWDLFPHSGFTGMQFFGLASDLAFHTARLPQTLFPEAKIQPVLRRLDAREFHISDYLFEARLGRGLLLGCTLRLPGGAGAQPAGLRRNIAGAALLQAMLSYLALPAYCQFSRVPYDRLPVLANPVG